VTTVGIATGAGRGMGLACARRLVDVVDAVLLVDRDEAAVTATAADLATSARGTVVEPFVVDVSDGDGLARLAARAAELGTLRAVAHAAGVSPTMADWRRIFAVDLVGTALLAEALRPLATAGTALVCFASMAPVLGITEPDAAADAAVDEPLDDGLLDRIHGAVGPAIEDPGMAYAWAKRGVQRLVQREAMRLGPVGARACSVCRASSTRRRAGRRQRANRSRTCWWSGHRSAASAGPRRSRPSSPSCSPTGRASSRASTCSSTAACARRCADPRRRTSERCPTAPARPDGESGEDEARP
jgi:NAD(P)-dependent dehydrogenase (short-subunit alcohol dehydrogenase family)